MSVTPGSTAKSNATPATQGNIASFFAKKTVAPDGVIEITPSVAHSKEKKAMLEKEVKILEADDTKSSAEKASAKVKPSPWRKALSMEKPVKVAALQA